jgi:hypothetical protein
LAEFALRSSKEEVHSCQREPQGQLAGNKRAIHHRSSALGHLLAAETKNKIRMSPTKVKKENVSQEEIPLRQEFHIQDGSIAALDPKLLGKHEFSTSATTHQSR